MDDVLIPSGCEALIKIRSNSSIPPQPASIMEICVEEHGEEGGTVAPLEAGTRRTTLHPGLPVIVLWFAMLILRFIFAYRNSAIGL